MCLPCSQLAPFWFVGAIRNPHQFYCRVQFARAYCASHDAISDTGAAKLRKVLDAVHFILLVLPIACDARKRPQYDFLVYNASVTYWHVARQLMKKTTFQFLVPSLTKIIDALKTVGERDIVWVSRLQLALVSAQIDAKQFANAAKTINEVVDMQLSPLLNDPIWTSNEELKALYDSAVRVQVHVGSLKDAECQKILPNVRKNAIANKRTSLLVKVQCLKSGNLSGPVEAAYTDIFQEATGFPSFSLTTTTDDEVGAFLHSLDARAIEAIDSEIIVETGIQAAFALELRMATCCDLVLQSKGKSLVSRFRVLHQVLKAILLVATPLSRHDRKQNAAARHSMMLSRRVDAMKGMERAILAAKRQGDADLVESVCICAWNLSLPLLQPHLRGQVSRVFTLSATALEETESLLLTFRARLHLEITKLEISSEFLSKAYEVVNKALSLDYGTPAVPAATLEEVLHHERDISTRPVDIHLVPLKKKLEWKLAMVDDSEAAPIDHIRAMVEQAKESKDVGTQRLLLGQAATQLAAQVNAMSAPRNSSDLVVLWHEVARLVWDKLHENQLAEQIAKQGLDLFFPSALESADKSPLQTEKSLMVLEIDLRSLLVDIIASRIKRRSEQVDAAKSHMDAVLRGGATRPGSRKPDQRNQAHEVELAALVLLSKETFALGMQDPGTTMATAISATSDENSDAIQAHKKTIEDEVLGMKRDMVEHVTASVTAAGRIGWRFVMENTCVYHWNYHFHLFRLLTTRSFNVQWILPECLAAFEAAYGTMEGFPGVDMELLASTALGLAAVYEKMARWDKVLAIAESFLKRKTAAPPLGSIAGHGAAASVTVNAIHMMRFAELKTRAQLAQNAKEVTLGGGTVSPYLRVAATLEALESSFQQGQSVDKSQMLYHKAATLWQSTAHEILAAFQENPLDLTLEEVQQQLEMYAELWVRVGCGAFRLQHFRFAIECATQALLALPAEKRRHQEVPLTSSAWRWLAVSEILCGRAILALGNGERAPRQLVLASLQHLVRAAEYGNRANTSALVLKASEVVWNAVLMVMSSSSEAKEYDEAAMKEIISGLKKVLHFLSRAVLQIGQVSSLYGDLVLLALTVCETASEWMEACGMCEDALGNSESLSPKVLNEIRTAYAIASANRGKENAGSGGAKAVGGSGSSMGGGKKNEQQDPILKAKILKKIAFSSMKDPPGQLQALASAYAELDGELEEQALVLMDLAEWFCSNRLPAQDTDAYLDSAAKLLLASESKAEESRKSRTTATAGGLGVSGSAAVATLKQQEPSVTYSALWHNEKLIQVFVMRAMTASSCSDRWDFIEKALHCVQRAWDCILAVASEMELQDAFAKAGVTDVDFDDWKRTQRVKHEPPTSSRDWVALYLRYAKSTDARFYMEWTSKLQSLQSNTSVLHFTEPVVTGFYLEKLLAMLLDGMLDEMTLPTICLYQVLYHGYSPEKTKTIELWLELTLFDILERLNLAACALPIQSALDIFHVHGKTILEELQQANDASSPSSNSSDGYVNKKGIKRRILQSSGMNVSDKLLSSAELFLRFGYIRQGKTALEMLKRVIHADDQARQSEMCMLSSSVHEAEGDTEAALAETERALRNPSLDLQKLMQWTTRCCDLDPDHEKRVKQLEDTEKLIANWLIASTSEGTPTTGELDILQWIAQLKCKRATLLLRNANWSPKNTETDANNIARSRLVFNECAQLLTQLDCKAMLSQCLVRNAQTLLTFHAADRGFTEHQTASEMGFIKSNLQKAIFEMEAMRLRIHRFYEWSAPTSRGSESAEVASPTFATPLEIELALAKTALAKIEIGTESSTAMIKGEEMTWYAYEVDSKRNIVEKWLQQTAPDVKTPRGGDLGLAMMLSSSAAAILSNAGLDKYLVAARVQVLQCQRLALFHGESKLVAKKIQRKLWTKFTSVDEPHNTWVCCGGSLHPVDNSAPSADRVDEDRSDAAAALQETEKIESFLTSCISELQNFQKVAWEKRDMELLRVCSYELIQVHGCDRPLDCIRSLLLYQSVAAREHLTEVFDRCASPRDAQQLHLRRMQKLQETHTNAMRHSLPYQLSLTYLEQQSAAFKRMSVAVPVETILGSLPPHKRLLSLQFSPDKCFLYCAVVGSGEKHYAMARMECTEPNMNALAHIRDRVLRWRSACAKMLAEFEEQHANDANFEFASTDSLVKRTLSSISSENDKLEKEFSGILIDTIDFFAPLFLHSAMRSVLHSELTGNALILLVDRELECLPLEALPAIEKAESIARDFSIHVLYERLQSQKAQPFRRDDMRCIVDPYHEDSGLDDQTMDSVLSQHVKRAGASFSNWKEAVEHGQPPTRTDWQQALLNRRSGGLFYLGANRVLGSSLSVHDLIGMSTSLNCHAVCLLDRAENQSSARRQSKVDSEKAAWLLELEDDAYVNAILWSLSGVNVFLMNQWTTTFNGNRRLASGLFTGLAKGFSIGKALKKYGDLVSPSGALTTAPPSTTSSAVSSTSNLPPGSSTSNASSTSNSNTNSSSALPSGIANLQKMDSVVAAFTAGNSSNNKSSATGKQRLKHRLRYNTIVYGLAHIALKTAE